jgi:hypothetical protein
MSGTAVTRGDRLPEGPWLLVLGMHRSGTSAMAGALGALGLATSSAEDRMDWPESNPEHWESLGLTLLDDRLLVALGGSWDAPPELAPGWPDRSGLPLHGSGDLFAHAYPTPGPSVWKDPRLCLLLPYWRTRLPGPLAVVHIWRSPLDVARSLQRRDGMHLADGLALWERYNRSALVNLDGTDAYLCRYEDLLDRPAETVGDLARWLGSLPQFTGHADGWDVGAAAASVTTGHQDPAGQSGDHGGATVLPEQAVLPEQEALAALLDGLGGGHRPLATPDTGPESAWTTAVIGARRGSRTREVARLEQQRDAAVAEVAALRASTSWRVTGPLRALTARRRPPAPPR